LGVTYNESYPQQGKVTPKIGKKLPPKKDNTVFLNDKKVRNAKPGINQAKLFDGDGLFLLITPSGGKWWRFKYRFDGKEKTLSFGTYPEVSLADAREKRYAARKQVAAGVDPGELRKSSKAAKATVSENSFENVAREWHSKFIKTWSATHAQHVLERLAKDVFPWIGARPIGEIKAPELLTVLRRIESRGALDTAHRVRHTCGQVFRYAVASGRAEHDPAADLRGALPPVKNDHFAAPTDPKAVAPLLRAIDEYQGSIVVKCALRLAPLLFVRPGELRHAEWAEIDFEAEQWNIPGMKMKMKEPHIVPLSRQALAVLRELQPLTGASRYVFPSGRSFMRPMSENAVNAALRRMGFEKTEITVLAVT
jgi:integrase